MISATDGSGHRMPRRLLHSFSGLSTTSITVSYIYFHSPLPLNPVTALPHWPHKLGFHFRSSVLFACSRAVSALPAHHLAGPAELSRLSCHAGCICFETPPLPCATRKAADNVQAAESDYNTSKLLKSRPEFRQLKSSSSSAYSAFRKQQPHPL